jgi:actin
VPCYALRVNRHFRFNMFKNIILTGGSSLFSGLKDHLQKEVVAVALEGILVEVRAEVDSKFLAWGGADIKAGKRGFEDVVVGRSLRKERN